MRNHPGKICPDAGRPLKSAVIAFAPGVVSETVLSFSLHLGFDEGKRYAQKSDVQNKKIPVPRGGSGVIDCAAWAEFHTESGAQKHPVGAPATCPGHDG